MESVLFRFGVGKSIANELNSKFAKMWLLDQQSLVQPSIGGRHLWYVVYRVLAAVYLLSTFLYVVIIIAMGQRPMLMYMHYPVVGYAVSVIGAVLHVYATYIYYSRGSQPTDVAIKSVRRLKGFRRRRFIKMGSKNKKVRKLYKAIWFAFNIQLFWSLFSLIVYHFGLFKGILPHVQPSQNSYVPDEVFLHIAYFVYTFTDFWISGIPVRLLHFYMVIAFDILYKIVSIAIYMILYSKYVGKPMYDFLSLSADRIPVCVMMYLGFTIIVPIAIHTAYFYLFLFRSHFIGWLLVTDRGHSQQQQQQQSEEQLQHQLEPEVLSAELLVPGAMDDSAVLGTPHVLPPSGMMTITELDENELENISNISLGNMNSRTALQQAI